MTAIATPAWRLQELRRNSGSGKAGDQNYPLFACATMSARAAMHPITLDHPPSKHAAATKAMKIKTQHRSFVCSRGARIHLVQRYGGMRFSAKPARGTLAQWQERRARELLESDLAHDLTIETLAAACKLSPTHFPRAFKASMGMPPAQMAAPSPGRPGEAGDQEY